MKDLLLIVLFIFSLPVCVTPQTEPTKCLFDQSLLVQPQIPNYLQPWWNSVRYGQFAVVFIDFKDGRYVNGNDTTQPYYDYQLQWVMQNGVADAAGEMGLVNEQTIIPVGSKYMKASKYTWFDRWNMLFDTTGVYYETAHPDWSSHGDSAWGSLKQYWKEASNGKFSLVPYVTHPNETDYRLRTGIVNDYVTIDGRKIIKCVTLPKKKYGTDFSNSYFRTVNDFETLIQSSEMMVNDTRLEIARQTEFDLNAFISAGGKLFIYFAGTHNALKDLASGQTDISPIRLREYEITDTNSHIDGFGVSAHQLGHFFFNWSHTNSGRCDIMNGFDVHDNNCPQLPNPVYRMREGWLQPFALDSAQQFDSLRAIETSYKCGVITIYGKPSESPDFSTGETFVIENRRRIGFDRKIVSNEILRDQDYRNFKGGLLVWQFSPYVVREDFCSLGARNVSLVHTDTVLCIASIRDGNPRTYFAWDLFQNNTLDTNKTYSEFKLKTGIKLSGIEQNNYADINSTMRFNLSYLLGNPTRYDHVIFNRALDSLANNYGGMTFYHEHDPYGKYRFAAGARIETVRDEMKFQGLTADGESTNKITFSGAGYAQYLRKYKKLEIIQKASLADTVILRNVDFTGNDVTYTYFISILGTQSQLAAPLIFSNVKTDRLQNGTDVFLRNCAILDFEVDSMKVSILKIGSSPTMIDNVRLSNSFLSLNSDIKSLNDASELRIVDSYVSTNNTFESVIKIEGISLKFINSEFDHVSNNKWEGFGLENSGNDSIINCTFSNAKTALSFINDEQHKFTNRIIKYCTFNIPSGGDHKGIYGENNYSILVEGNRFNMPVPPPVDAPFYIGLYLKNVTPSSPPESAGEEGASATPYSLNIVNNTFRNGSSGIVLANYTSNLLPYYIKGNRFDSLDANAAMANIIGMNVTGTIKDNVLSSSLTPIGIHLIKGYPNLLNNIVNARDVALHLTGSSYASLAPNIYNNKTYWSAGKNTLSSYLYDNIQLSAIGNAYTDYGRNKFTVSNDSAYHVYGWLDTNVLRYHSRDNCWYTSGAARIYLRHPGATLPVPSTTYNYGINCNSSPGPISWEVDNLGNGIFDSVLVSEDVSDSIPSAEEILISQCDHYLNEMQMFGEAVISLKYYIDDYPEGEYVNDALMDLYTAYLYLDTSADQNNRNILYGNLINYCEDKVAGNLYDAQFEYLAGDVIAMCNFELDNYDDAMNWYEFIALYYPDPDIRLTASWNYAEIEALIGSGSGGGETEIENGKLKIESVEGRASTEYIEFLEELEIEKLHEEIVDDPVMRKLMKKFENKNYSDGMEQANRSDDSPNTLTKHSDAEAGMTAKLKNDKARKNIFSSMSMSREQQEADRMKDIFLITANARNGKVAPGNAGIPSEFSLHQNYPNPFNPVTTISYDLPNSGIVTLKVYDMLGREVKTLVNELKTAGYHKAQFTAEDLASGAYFYRLSVSGKAGEFTAVKKCVVVK